MTGAIVADRYARSRVIAGWARQRAGMITAAFFTLAVVVATATNLLETQKSILFLGSATGAVYFIIRGWLLREPWEAHKGVADVVVGGIFVIMVFNVSAVSALVNAVVLVMTTALVVMLMAVISAIDLLIQAWYSFFFHGNP
jgi:hypothetical protein